MRDIYTLRELDALIDMLILYPPPMDECITYSINGVYVSKEVIDVRMNERLEAMAATK